MTSKLKPAGGEKSAWEVVGDTAGQSQVKVTVLPQQGAGGGGGSSGGGWESGVRACLEVEVEAV